MLQVQTRPSILTIYGGNMKRKIIVDSVVSIDGNYFTVEAMYGTVDAFGTFKPEIHATADGKFKRIKVAGETHVIVEEFVMDDVGSLSPNHVDMVDVEWSLDEYIAKRSA